MTPKILPAYLYCTVYRVVICPYLLLTLYEAVYTVVICLSCTFYLSKVILFTFMQWFFNLLQCACIKPLPERHNMHDNYARFSLSSSLSSVICIFLVRVLASGTCPNRIVWLAVFYISVHVLASGIRPNCALYPAVTPFYKKF